MTWLGCVSAAFLAVCALPQTVRSVRTGRADDLSALFLLLWFAGELTGLAYVASLGDLPLIANYGANLVLVGVILAIKFLGGGDAQG